MRRPRAWFLAAVLGALAGCGEGSNSGDRVLVSKIQYESGIRDPQRYDVVVFKYPGKHGLGGPVEGNTPKNYIKRLLGLPGEIIAIFFGRLFRFAPRRATHRPTTTHKDPRHRRQGPVAGNTCTRTTTRPRSGSTPASFEILRKPPDVMMALRRIVYDNDFPAKDMKTLPARWEPAKDSAWADEERNALQVSRGKAGAESIGCGIATWCGPTTGQPPATWKPELITDFMGYNAFETRKRGWQTPSHNWVGDLMLECQVEATKGEGEFWLELSKGIHRFQARWDLASGMCTLFKDVYEIEDGPKVLKQVGKSVELDSKPTKLRGPGTYQVRFANIDARLTVWVDRELPFGDGKDYQPPEVLDPSDDKDDIDQGPAAARAHDQRPRTRQHRQPRRRGARSATCSCGATPTTAWSPGPTRG